MYTAVQLDHHKHRGGSGGPTKNILSLWRSRWAACHRGGSGSPRNSTLRLRRGSRTTKLPVYYIQKKTPSQEQNQPCPSLARSVPLSSSLAGFSLRVPSSSPTARPTRLRDLSSGLSPRTTAKTIATDGRHGTSPKSVTTERRHRPLSQTVAGESFWRRKFQQNFKKYRIA